MSRFKPGQIVLMTMLSVWAAVPAVALYASFIDATLYLLISAVAGASTALLMERLEFGALTAWFASILTAVILLFTLGAGVAVGSGSWAGTTTFERIWRDWLSGPARILSANLPLDATVNDVAFYATLTYCAAVCGGLLVIRSASPVLPLAPGGALWSLSVAVSAGAPRGPSFLAIGFVVIAGTVVVVRASGIGTAQSPGVDSMASRVVRTLMLVGFLGAGAVPLVVLSPWTADGDRADPRRLVAAEFQLQEPVSPLSRIKAQLSGPPVDLFEVEPLSGPVGDRIRIAAFERFNGILWDSAHAFKLAGHHFYADPATPSPQRVAFRVVVTGLTGPYLPVIGRPRDLAEVQPSERQLGIDDISGTLIDADEVRAGFRYQMAADATIPVPGIEKVTLIADPALAPYVTVPPDVPPQLRSYALQFTASGDKPFAALKNLELRLREQPYRLDVPAGQSYGAVSSLLGIEPGSPATSGGFAEQRASAFALLARLIGIPTRVVVGYRLPAGGKKRQVTTAHAHAWPEAFFPGYGWMPFEPTDVNQRARPSAPPSPGLTQVPPPPTPRPELANSAKPPPVHPPVSPAGPPVFVVPRSVWVLFVVVPMAALAMLLGLKQRRRSRRRLGAPADRVRGAWREAMDRLYEAGYREQACDAASETAVRAAKAWPGAGPIFEELAGLATVAQYSPGSSDEDAATRSWQLERDAWRAITVGRFSAARRVRTLLNPRPLWRRRSPTPAREHPDEES